MNALYDLALSLEFGEPRNSFERLLKSLSALAEIPCLESGGTDERCWEAPGDEWPRSEWCKPCLALEPLFRQEGQG